MYPPDADTSLILFEKKDDHILKVTFVFHKDLIYPQTCVPPPKKKKK